MAAACDLRKFFCEEAFREETWWRQGIILLSVKIRTWWVVLIRKEVKVELALGGLPECIGGTSYICPYALTAHVFLHVVKLYISNLNLLM